MGRRPQRRGWLLDDDDDDGDDDDDDEEEEEDGEPNTSNNGSSLPAPSGTFPTNASGYPLTTSAHPLRLQDRIVTGHRANIFSAKFLPNANTPTIVSCAGDCDIRVFEVERLSRHVGAHGGALDGTSGPG
jgi:hypothetical protein